MKYVRVPTGLCRCTYPSGLDSGNWGRLKGGEMRARERDSEQERGTEVVL